MTDLTVRTSTSTREVPVVKAGFKTSEFFVTALGVLLSAAGVLGDVLPEPWGKLVATLSAALLSTTYVHGRAKVKLGR